MDNKTIWFPADKSLSSGLFSFPCEVVLTVCYKCGRKFVVSSLVNGTSHNLGLGVCCGSCYVPNSLSESRYPEQTKEILDWIKEN